ncbi:DUF1450 domain-containing protein [Paenibacillus filicis]|uniref:DUF1450 domain-containing protein n=1 Tax=Paenibacillus filicis TaxID=669464 RepID=A0ABU9DQU7_9BACL
MSLGLVVVEVCQRNAMAAVMLEELEAEYPEVAVLHTDCLSMCHVCRAVPYAMVNGKRVLARSAAACLDLIGETAVKEIKELLNDDN